MLNIMRYLSPRAWRDRLSARKVRSEIETLRRWSKRSAHDRNGRDG